MKPETHPIIDADWSGVDAALDRAFERALEVGRRTGAPVWIMRDGKMIDALSEEREAVKLNGTHEPH